MFTDIEHLIIAIVAYVAGIVTGYIFREFFFHNAQQDDKGNNFILFVVTCVWAVSVLADILDPKYDTSPMIHGLMGAIVGYFYRFNIFGKNEKNG